MSEPRRFPIPHLRAWRLYRRKNHAELAKAAGVGRSTIIRLEKPGEPANELTIYKIAGALDIGVQQLLNEEPPEKEVAA